MAEFNPTPDQRDVIETDVENLLVSAAAGSGKTATLVQRIARMVEEEKVSVDRLAVVTFTKAAAAELRRRLYEILTERAAKQSGNARLTRQAMMLGSAQISTVHSFCFSLLQEYKKECGLAGRIRICDESEAALFLRESIEEVLEERLAEGDPEFAECYSFFSSSRSDRKFVSMLYEILTAADSYPGRVGYLKEADRRRRAEYASMQAGASFADTGPGRYFCERAGLWAKGQIALLRSVASQAGPDVADFISAPFEAMIAAFCGAADDFAAGRIEAGFEKLSQNAKAAYRFPDVRNRELKAALTPERMEWYKELRGYAKSALDSIANARTAYSVSTGEALEDYRDTLRLTAVLIPLLEAISLRYREKKREKGLLDYADLEHCVLELVAEKGEDGCVPTEAARRIGAGIDAMFVDEYQDTNPVQDEIFRAITAGGKLFIVGDPKQSVYRFRGAAPKIFTDRKNAFPPLDRTASDQREARILLSENFRCDKSVIDYTNEVFRTVMDAEAPGSLYAEEDELRCSKPTDKQEAFKCEWLFVNKSFSAPEADPGREATAETEAIAEEISAILGGKIKKRDGSLYRPSEIAVLCRTSGQFSRLCASLARRGIAGSVAENDTILSEPETLFMTSLLEALENPMDDVALLGALSSPVFRFSSDDLYGLRLAYPELRFFNALSRAAEKDGETAAKARAFLEKYFALLEKSRALPLQELIWACYETLAVRENYLTAGRGGETQRYLMDAARDFETFSLRSIPAFLDYLRENRRTFADPLKTESVTIQTMHKSKGLEYPIVFAAFLGKEFNRRDERGLYLLSDRFGLLTLVPRLDGAVRWETCLCRCAGEEKRAEALEEEKRVLYVAMTRAKNKLYLTADSGRTKLSTLIARAGLDLPEPLSDAARQSVVRGAGSHLEFLLAAANQSDVLRRVLARAYEVIETEKAPFRLGDEPPAEGENAIVSFRGAVKVTPAGEKEKKAARRVFDPAELEKILSFEYEDDGRTELPKKLSVSEILARGREEEADLAPRTLLDFQNGLLRSSAAFAGTSMHEVMQYADFAAAERDLGAELDRLLAEGFLTREAFEVLDREKLAAFFRSPFYRRLKASPKVVHEKRFNVLLDGKDLIGKEGEVLVQGVIDVSFEKEDGTVCVADFKTDRVRDPDGEAILRERHGAQLRLYARAVEAVTEKPVTELLIYSFALGRAVEVPVVGQTEPNGGAE